MTPEERAEILVFRWSYIPKKDWNGAHENLAKLIAAEIRAAVEDRAADDVLRCERLLVKAKAEAYEDAIKIVEKDCADCHCGEIQCETAQCIADELRARKDEVCK